MNLMDRYFITAMFCILLLPTLLDGGMDWHFSWIMAPLCIAIIVFWQLMAREGKEEE